MAGLSIWKAAHERDPRYSVGLSTTVVLDPEGTTPFGTSGCGHQGELGTAINYDATRFLQYLKESRQRYLRSRNAQCENNQQMVRRVELESMAQLRKANICKCEVKKEVFPSLPASESE